MTTARIAFALRARRRCRPAWLAAGCTVTMTWAICAPAGAQAPPPAPGPVPSADLPASPPPPYVVPFFLRPMPAVNVGRLDTVLAPHDRIGPAASGLALDVVQVATVGARLFDWAQIVARTGWDWTSDPGWVGLSNLVLAANLSWRFETAFRLAVFAALDLPTGTDASGSQVHASARVARLALDNALFVTDHVGGIIGAGFGYVDHGWTIQLDATLLVFGRAEGTGDEAVVNSTFGLLVGYFVVPELSVAGEIHHQHFVSDPAAVAAQPELRSQTSATLGLRAHAQLGQGVWLRPGVSWSVGFDPPMSADAWQVFQLDVPVFF